MVLLLLPPRLHRHRDRRCCSDVHYGYSVLVESLEDNSNSLTQLDMTLSEFEHLRRPLRHQFTCSLPKIQRLQKLSCEVRLLSVGHGTRDDGDDAHRLLMAAAFFQNTSLLQVTTIDETDTRCVPPVLQRNLDLLRIRSLLAVQQQQPQPPQPPQRASSSTATTTTLTTTTTVPVALWSHVFCRVGGQLRQRQQQVSSNRSSDSTSLLLDGSARADASPIFVVLRDRPNAFIMT
jgi:hypothetical protein